MSLSAIKPLSIAEFTFEPGEQITNEALRKLPRGRLPQLITGGYVEETADEIQMARDIQGLQQKIEVLEETVKLLRAQVARMGQTQAKRTNGPTKAGGGGGNG